MSPRVYGSARNRILDAAEAVILERGIAELSVDAVVREAQLSKGGFFHHFASKEALLAAIIERLAAVVDQQIVERAAHEPARSGAKLRAQVQLATDMPKKERERLRALVLALIAASMESDTIAAGARAANQKALTQAVKDGVPLGRALMVQFALDGYWLAESLGTMVLSARQKKAFRHELEQATKKGGKK